MYRITVSYEGQEAMSAGLIIILFVGSQDSDF